MFRIKVSERGDLDRDLRETASRANDVSPAAPAVMDAMERQNQGVNFSRNHETSILESDGETGEIGARSPRESYAALLDIDEDEIGDIVKSYIVDGDT
jgi:hypothetical protein